MRYCSASDWTVAYPLPRVDARTQIEIATFLKWRHVELFQRSAGTRCAYALIKLVIAFGRRDNVTDSWWGQPVGSGDSSEHATHASLWSAYTRRKRAAWTLRGSFRHGRACIRPPLVTLPIDPAAWRPRQVAATPTRMVLSSQCLKMSRVRTGGCCRAAYNKSALLVAVFSIQDRIHTHEMAFTAAGVPLPEWT